MKASIWPSTDTIYNSRVSSAWRREGQTQKTRGHSTKDLPCDMGTKCPPGLSFHVSQYRSQALPGRPGTP